MSTQFDREFDELAHTEDAYLYGDAESENEVSEINSPAVGITEEMIADGVQALTESSGEVYSVQVPDKVAAEQLVRQVLGAALAGRTVMDLPEPTEVRDDAVFWRVEGRRIAASVDGCGRPFVLVDSQIWLVGEAEAVALAKLAAVRKARLASGSSESGEPT